MSQPEYVRAKDRETGHHVSILRSQFDFNPDAWQLLKQDATHADGSPRAPKHQTSVAPASDSTTNAGQSAVPKKES